MGNFDTVQGFMALREALQRPLTPTSDGRVSPFVVPALGAGAANVGGVVGDLVYRGGGKIQNLPYTGGATVQNMALSPAEQWIIQRESGGRTNAYNPVMTSTGHAFGIGQLTDVNRKKYLGADWQTTDYAKQLQAFRSYVKDRYGTPEKAQQFWQQHGWY